MEFENTHLLLLLIIIVIVGIFIYTRSINKECKFDGSSELIDEDNLIVDC